MWDPYHWIESPRKNGVLVDGENGFVIHDCSSRAVAQVLKNVSDLYDKTDSVSCKCRDFVLNRFDFNAMIDQYIEITK